MCSVMGAQVAHNQRRSVLVDLLTVYGQGGKAIVFTDRKRDADEVAAAVALSMPCEVRQPLLSHCYMPQADVAVRIRRLWAPGGVWPHGTPACMASR